MDYILSKSLEKKDFKVDSDMDISANYDSSELMSSDFFDSILSLEKSTTEESESVSRFFDNLELHMNQTSDGSEGYDDIQCDSLLSDSGASSDLPEQMLLPYDEIPCDNSIFGEEVLLEQSACAKFDSSNDEIPEAVLDEAEMLERMTHETLAVSNVEMPCEESIFGKGGQLDQISRVKSEDDETSEDNNTDDTGEIDQMTFPKIVTVKPIKYVRPIVAPKVQVYEPEKPKIINIIKPIQKPKKVIKVQPLNGNSRSVLLPINIKDLKTIKIINTNNLKAEKLKFTSAKKIINEKYIIKPTRKTDVQEKIDDAVHRRHRQQSATTTTSDEVSGGEDHGNQYPLLLLTPEEKRLLSKDGIQLPCRYPLTKHEERELKRIRRKIRNKISAQDSRKRKKEYVDGLEERVKHCSEENRSLVKRIKLLQLQNNKLSSQLSKLQALVFKTGTSRAHPATCLMIVLLSVMLVTLPNLRNNGNTNAVDKELNTLQQFVARRALLFSQQATNEDTSSLNMDEFITFPSKKTVKTDNAQEIIDTVNHYPKNGKSRPNMDTYDNYQQSVMKNRIDYGLMDDDGSGGHGSDGDGGGDNNFFKQRNKRYIEPDIDESWPPEKKQKQNISMPTAIGQRATNRTEYYE